MSRILIVFAMVLFLPVSVRGSAEKPGAEDEEGLVKIEAKGKLVVMDGRYCVEAKNPVFNEPFLVQLLRSEDKNRVLDNHIKSLVGQVVVARGVLRFTPQRTDGPKLAIPISSESQVRKATKE